MHNKVIEKILETVDLMGAEVDDADQEGYNLMLRLKLLRSGLALVTLVSEKKVDADSHDTVITILESIVEVYKGLLKLVPGAEAKAAEEKLLDLIMSTSNIKGEA